MTESIPEWLAEFQAEEQRRLARLPAAKAALLAALSTNGIARVSIEYDGEGDSGQINGISAENAAGERAELKGSVRLHLEAEPRDYDTLERAVEDFAWELLSLYHAGFVNNEGGLGTIELEVAEQSIVIDHNDRIIEFSNTVTEV